VDLHTHLGVLSAPILAGIGSSHLLEYGITDLTTTYLGAVDLNSNKGPIVPWLRSIDGLNTHDDSYELAMAGGVTSAQVLPGSKNAIGLRCFVGSALWDLIISRRASIHRKASEAKRSLSIFYDRGTPIQLQWPRR